VRVEVIVEPAVRDQVVQVYVGRGASREDALLRAIADIEEIRRVLTAHSGTPPLAKLRRRGEDGSWWLYSGSLWVGITRDERYEGVRPFGRWVRTLTVVAAGPPAPA
jgi:hypothetical protein